ncbi:hypothetical protein PALB_3420 [Pseudoalteromonas luteoviolacea B = ATCC 29581]|nr:hypothetical protein PALB_3420 [Pseudoalteromonas luteoviolacea B = ATCC 29581]
MLEYQVDTLFSLSTGTPARKPYRMSDIQDALRYIRLSEPDLHRAISDKINVYEQRDAITRQGAKVMLKSGEVDKLANDRGNQSDEYLQLDFEGIWRGSENTLMQVGIGYRAHSTKLIPYNTFVAYSLGNVQFDLGYREHWFSPFKHFGQVFSTNAKPSPSVSLSLVSPLRNWWNFDVELFYSELDHVNEGFYFQDKMVSGTPQLAGSRFSIEPIDGWTLGVNRMMQFGGGPRPVSFSDVVKAFFDPAGQDNRGLTGGTFDSELGDQWATLTSTHQFTDWYNAEVYFEYGGEDTSGHKNYRFGNLVMNAGVFLPRLTADSSLRYEYSNMHSRWYINNLYFKNGNTIDGFVVGNFAADNRLFGDDNPLKAHVLEWVQQSNSHSHWRVKYTTTYNENDFEREDVGLEFDYQHRAHELEVVRSERWQNKQAEAKLALGKDVFGENYAWLSLNVYW